MSRISIETVATTPHAGQKPGTSGLRKKVTEFQKPHYLENFVQSIFNSLPAKELQGAKLVVSGDGRYLNKEAIDTILRMMIANGLGGAIIGVNGLMSTPCVSAVIRQRQAYGGIVLTASHNPGGPHEDFGIKYNCSNGGPAPESLTDNIYKQTTTIKEYKIVKEKLNVDLSVPGVHTVGNMSVEVIDAPKAYADLMASIFDFAALRSFLSRKDFTFVYDAMHGVAGPFAREIFVNQLGANPSCLLNATPKLDFGGGHPDPNLTYAHDLVAKMGLDANGAIVSGMDASSIPDFGAAADGDADRNMILGRQFFVTPSDSLAVIVANAHVIPYFHRNGVSGVARSMPTSAAVDRVASSKLNIPCYEVPTGWKFFGNLMDASKISICGEESFGTGSDHIREKDGVWAVLAWLSILEYYNRSSTSIVSVASIVQNHWKTYGRNYYSRYDYENVDSDAANRVMSTLLDLQKTLRMNVDKLDDFTIASADEFTYHDPVDKSVSEHQGIRFIFSDGSRIVFRLSGTGSVGATIRVYIEKYEKNPEKLQQETQAALAPLAKIALNISKMQELTGRDRPTVIT